MPRYPAATILNRCLPSGRWDWFVAAVLVVGSTSAAAQVVNGDFETGDLSGWTPSGTSVVEVLQATNFSPDIPQPEGTYYCLLSTGPDNQGGGGSDLDGNGTDEFDIARLRQTFTTPVDDDVITFRWGFLSREADQPAQYDDIFHVTLDGVVMLFGSTNKPGGISTYPDTPPYDGLNYNVSSPGPTDGSWYWDTVSDGFTGFSTFSIVIPTAGAHTIEFVVADQGDAVFDSGLLIDEVILNSSLNVFQLTSTIGSNLESKSGGLVWTASESTSAAISDNGLVTAFVSTGDYGTGNPNVEHQVFVREGTGMTRLTSMTDGAATRPSLSADGRFVAFSATDNPHPAPAVPNNDDLNQEIFIADRQAGLTIQITATTVAGCGNSNPSLGGSLSERVAFQSDCSDLSGAGGDTTVVVWAGAAFRTLPPVAGCISRSPEISADGRWVAFISNCDHTGGNPDANWEVFLWDLLTPSITQVTDSAGAAGHGNDSVDLTGDGSVLTFVSNADYDPGVDNSDENFEVFLTTGGTITQLTDTAFDAILGIGDLHLVARITDDGRFVAWERLSLAFDPTTPPFFTQSFTISAYDRLLFSGNTLVGGEVHLPDIGVDYASHPTEPRAVVTFQSDQELVPLSNPDTNLEIFTSRLIVDTGGGGQTFCSTLNPPLAIPDRNNTGVSDTITIPDIGVVGDVDIDLRIDHTFVGDLVVRLSHDGVNDRRIIQRTRSGPSGGNGTCSGDDVDAVLDDEGARSVDFECNAVPPAILSPPNLIPDSDDLSDFDGTASAGSWTINVRDRRNNNIGTLNEWCVIITPQ